MESEPTFWDQVLGLWDRILHVLEYTLFTLGETHFNVLTLLYLVGATVVLIWFSNRARRILVKRILLRYNVNRGLSESIGMITRYVILIIGLIVILTSAGVNLSSLSILAGALGIGIGFGLQNIANNFISGVIILLENPIKVGDRIQVGEIHGNVSEIKARATVVNTNDNIDIIVPNSEFINSQVINWSLNDRNVRIKLPVGVSYSEKPNRIKQLLLEIAEDMDGVLPDPAPEVWFVNYGESSIDFELVFWTKSFIETPQVLKSNLYYAIFEKFDKEGVEIPFPQRDIHIRTDQTRPKG